LTTHQTMLRVQSMHAILRRDRSTMRFASSC
jgi:hypothetical protein